MVVIANGANHWPIQMTITTTTTTMTMTMLKFVTLMCLFAVLTDSRSIKCCDRQPIDQNEQDNSIIPDWSFLPHHIFEINGWKSWPIIRHLTELGENQVKAIYQDIIDGIETALSCDTCRLVLSLAHVSVLSAKELNYLMASVCHTFHIEDRRVCQGLSNLYTEQLYFILKHSNLTHSEMCATLIGAQCLSQSDQCLHRNNWSLRLPNKSSAIDRSAEDRQKRSAASGQVSKPRILHLSDLHIDPYYEPGANSGCGEPLCCRQTSAAGKAKAGYWGDYQSCDSPDYTIQQLVAHINASLSDQFQYVIWTGDIVAHDIWNTTRLTIINGSQYLTQLIKRYISNGKQVFPVIGNHEGLPVNQFSPPQITGNLSTGWLYTELLSQWSEWIPSKYVDTFKRYGYYANEVMPELKIIVMNTNYCARLNFWLLYDPYDPGQQLEWLSNELLASESKGQSVHIVGHIPPDNTQCTSLWLHNYLRIIERYNRTIKGQFFGHTHFDEFRLLYSTNNTADVVGMAYLTPSVTAYEGVNPAFRIYSIDSEATVLDHHTYYLNLTEANIYRNESTLQWIEEYSAKVSYNMSSLLNTDWEALYQKMKSDDHLFAKYYSHYHRYSDAFSADFDSKTRLSLLESIPISDSIQCEK